MKRALAKGEEGGQEGWGDRGDSEDEWLSGTVEIVPLRNL